MGWTSDRMGSVPNFFNGWKLFFKDFINVYIFEYFCEQFIYVILCYVIYFSLLIWHTRSSVDPFSILSASDECECHKVLYRNPFCLMAIQCLSNVKYFWCERAITSADFGSAFHEVDCKGYFFKICMNL